MDTDARAELASIKQELSSIITELDSIADGVRSDFVGIGNEQCASCIDRVADQYRYVKRKLDNMDTSTVTESYAKAHENVWGEIEISDIVVDTYNLKQYAQRLYNVNSRIVKLDWRLKTLYSPVGITVIWNLIRTDVIIGFSWLILRCQSYLSQTAIDFENVENELFNYDSLNFTGEQENEIINTDVIDSVDSW